MFKSFEDTLKTPRHQHRRPPSYSYHVSAPATRPRAGNTVLATKTALKLAEYCVTEAGFGADLGAEKSAERGAGTA